MALTFYYLSGSPFSWKVWLALEHKKIAYDFHLLSVDKGDLRSDEYSAINPRHKAPAIVDNGFALTESAVIVDYLEEKYTATGASLWPQDVNERALARKTAADITGYLYPPLRKLAVDVLFRREGRPDIELVTEAKETIGGELTVLQNAFKGDFITGSEISAADFTLYPFTALLKRIDDMRPGYDAFELVPDRIKHWMTRVEALPYFAKTTPPHWAP